MNGQRNGKKIAAGLFSVICLLLSAGAIFLAVRYWVEKNRTEQLYESLREESREEPSTAPERTEPVSSEEMTEPPTTAAPLPEDENMLREIDFGRIQAEVNADIYAWIWIPDTNIDYPILQHPDDNSYYLRHNPDGSEGFPGCIYTEKENSREFDDFNTLIYGHNMRDGSMFHDVRNYGDAEYLQNHPYIYIYLPDRALKYEIFASYEYDNRHLLYAFSYETAYDRTQYLKGVLEQRNMTAVFQDGVEVGEDDRIITLSTCVHATGPGRHLLQAVLIEEYENTSGY